MDKTVGVSEFIQRNWDKCKRYEPHDSGTLIGMPYPYITPTVSNVFQEMYYWDSGNLNYNRIVIKPCMCKSGYLYESVYRNSEFTVFKYRHILGLGFFSVNQNLNYIFFCNNTILNNIIGCTYGIINDI